MVKKISLIVVIFISLKCFSQKPGNYWWFKTTENMKYEKNYKNTFSDIKEGILKYQIERFIDAYITNTNKQNEEVAIIVSLLNTSNANETAFRITYMSDYYGLTDENANIQQISEVKQKIVFVINEFTGDIRIQKEVIFGLLRSKFKEIATRLNEEYQNLKKDGGGIPLLFVSEHQVPSWVIIIKDNELHSKEIFID